MHLIIQTMTVRICWVGWLPHNSVARKLRGNNSLILNNSQPNIKELAKHFFQSGFSPSQTLRHSSRFLFLKLTLCSICIM